MGVLAAASTARAALPVIYVIPAGGTWAPADSAVGLFVPGAGKTLTRRTAIESLERGKVRNSLLGGTPSGRRLARIVFGTPPASTDVPYAFVTIPTPQLAGRRLFFVAIHGRGYSGILKSDATRIRGLVPVAEIAPTLVALQEGKSPPIGFEPDVNAVEDLTDLEQRLTRVRGDRGWVVAAVVVVLLVLIAVAPSAAVVAGAAAIAAALVLSALGATQLWVLLLGIVALTVVFALAASRFIAASVAAFFVVYLLVLAFSPETNALAALGPRPDGGSRFYGMTNLLETLLLAPLIAAVAAAGTRWLIPLGAIALVTVGWSKAGADGGGILVYGTALAVLAFRLRAVAFSARRVVFGGAAVVALGVALVAIDAALGGSSHVTRALDDAPDIGARLHLSWETATESWHRVALLVVSIAALVWMGTRTPRRATVDAMLAALAVSLVVNDTPVDVAGLGALGCLALLRWESVDSRPMRRGAPTVAACFLAVLTLGGCGDEGVVSPTPETVVGTVAQEAPGRAVFLSQGCGACHMFTPAGSSANGTIGPNLDDLAQFAQRAGEPVDEFTHEGIVDPDAYVEKGFPKGVMPKSYEGLPEDDIDALVEFLTQQQG